MNFLSISAVPQLTSPQNHFPFEVIAVNEWKLVQRDPSEELARLHFFSVKKKHAGGAIEARITVKEFVTFKTTDMAYFASADVELNQRTMKFQPCGWSDTLAGALSECLRNFRKFDYEANEDSTAVPSDCGR